MIKAADSPMVPTDLWIEAHDYRFKSLLMKGEDQDTIEEAIETLKKIWYILPPLPVDGLWYIGDAQQDAEEKKLNKFEENIFKKASPARDEYDDNIDIVNLAPAKSPKRGTLKKCSTASSGFFLSIKDGKTHRPKSRETILKNIRKHIRGSSKDFKSLNSSEEAQIKGLQNKKNKKEELKTPSVGSSSESSGYDDYDNYLRVTFKSDFLYQIGKVAAKSGFMLEKALKFLNDFLLIINFYKQDMENKSYQKLRAHAIYYIGIAFFQLGDKEMAEKILREIQTDLIGN